MGQRINNPTIHQTPAIEVMCSWRLKTSWLMA